MVIKQVAFYSIITLTIGHAKTHDPCDPGLRKFPPQIQQKILCFFCISRNQQSPSLFDPHIPYLPKLCVKELLASVLNTISRAHLNR